MNLTEHLRKSGQTPYAFFKAHGLPRDPVYRAVKGKTVSYPIAKRISAATGDDVSITELME